MIKHRRKVLLLSLHSKPFHNNIKSYLSTSIFASFIGTYLDLWMVGEGYYTFPNRPFPNIFIFNIVFTLCVLPLSTTLLIYIFNKINRFFKWVLSLSVSIVMAALEPISEHLGFFIHSREWNHLYSLIGYLLFIFIIWNFYKWLNK